MNGLILIDKPPGITSFDVIKTLKKTFNTKAGHGGVLDKFASGLLVCGIGKATKLLFIFEKSYKVYLAEIAFGYETDTLDIFGKIIHKSQYYPDIKEICSLIKNKFMGKIEQEVPLFSNVKINGKRLYKYALSHENIKPPTKVVYISNIKILSYCQNTLKIEVTCSKGTYIRALARDIAHDLGSYATVTSLRRLYIYPFHVKNSVDINNISCDNVIEIEKFKTVTKIHT